ncbi:MAG TPA: bestrophin family protein [Aliidongia sp.]|nr:bestrophin family protein [Aliidongia sp.]
MPPRTSVPHSKVGLRDLLFAVRGSIVPHIALRVIVLTALSCGVVYWVTSHDDPFAGLGTAPFTLIGISISIFMSFRNNACYDRWWEGRRQWGHLVVAARSLVRETMPFRSKERRERILRSLCGYTHALAARLRGLDEAAAARAWLPARADGFSAGANVSNAILNDIGRELSSLAEDGEISEWRYTMLEARLVEISTVQAACERIKNTRLPFAYTLLIHRTTYAFCCLLPFGLATHLGWGTPVIVAVVSYTFFGLDAIGDQLEDPFGKDDNDLPLDELVRIVEDDISAGLDA